MLNHLLLAYSHKNSHIFEFQIYFFKSLYFMLFYEVKIERAIKGNSNSVTGK